MNVRELREALSEYPDEMLVVMSKDSEGNDFSPLYEAQEGMYHAETTWYGEVHPTPEQIAADDAYTEEDEAPEGAERAVVLWPTN